MTTARGPFRRITRLTSTNPRRWRAEWQSMHPASIAARALELARADTGYTEEPTYGRNDNRYGREWRENLVPWCGLFVASKWRAAGFDVPRSLALQIDYVPRLVELARNREYGLFVVGRNRVRKGDAVALYFGHDRGGDHVELFDRWIDKKAGVFATIGGNTSIAGSQSNGGAVCPQVRYMSETVAFVRKGR